MRRYGAWVVLTACVLLNGGAAERLGLRVPAGMVRIEPGAQSGEPMYEVISVVEHGGDEVPPGPYSGVHALCVGVNEYAMDAYSPLSNAVNDAVKLADALEQTTGAQTTVLTNDLATLTGVSRALGEIARKSTAGDLFIFHFSGHGVGLRSGSSTLGRLLLHDAPPLVNGQAPRSGEGVIEMGLIDRMIEAAGIRAKHRLFIFDACYSGLGAGTRDVFGGRIRKDVDADAHAVETSLAYRASYLITAGGSRHLVLDRGRTYPEHGLLTGHLIAALQTPERFGRPVEFAGRRYLPVTEAFLGTSKSINHEAGDILRTAFSQWRQRATSMVKGRTAGPMETIFQAAADDPTVLLRSVQNPQDDRLRGEGRVYLPLLDNVNERTEPAPAPVAKNVGWAEAAGERYGSLEYGRALEELLEMLEKGSPPEGAATPLSVTAELEYRPIMDPREFIDVSALREKYSLPRNDQRALALCAFAEVEGVRNRISGAQWHPVAQAGQALSAHHEIRLRVENKGSAPVHYYLAALDGSGIVQWLAPANDSAGEEGRSSQSTFGPAQLGKGQGNTLILPPEADSPAGRAAFGWPVIATRERLKQVFILVVTAQRWPEFEEVLLSASRQGFKHLAEKKNAGAGTVPLSGSMPLLPLMRAVGAVQMQLEGDAESDHTGGPEIRRFSQDGLMILSWTLEVKPPDQLKAHLRPRTP